MHIPILDTDYFEQEVDNQASECRTKARPSLVPRLSARCWYIFSRDPTYLIARGQGLLERQLHFSTFCSCHCFSALSVAQTGFKK